ncbi:MAG: PfkB family carbohydrate kinase [Gemmobacter sp.]
MAPAGAAARPGPEAIAIGALLWDVIATATAEGPFAPGDDVPGRVVCRPGGVALNLALALQRAGIATAILAQVGADAAGRALLRAVARQGVATHGIDPLPGVATGRYVAIEAGGRLIGAVADTGALETAGRAALLAALEDGRIASPGAPWRGLAVIDGNLSAPLLAEIAAGGLLAQADLRLCVPSPAKARRLAPLARLAGATLYLNRAEAEAFCAAPLADARRAAAALIGAGVARVLVTDGAAPAAFATAGGPILTATPAAVPVRRVTGAGDALVAAHVAAERAGAEPPAALAAALAAAARHIAGETAP